MTKLRRAKIGRVRIQPYLSATVARRLANFSAAKGTSESQVVESALCRYLDGVGDAALIHKQLGRLGRSQQRLHRELNIFMQVFSAWTKSWHARTLPIPGDMWDSAQRSAEAWHRDFVELLRQELGDGRHFVDSLVREVIGDEDELEALAQADDAAAVAKVDNATIDHD